MPPGFDYRNVADVAQAAARLLSIRPGCVPK